MLFFFWRKISTYDDSTKKKKRAIVALFFDRRHRVKDGFDLIPGLRSNITVPVTPNNNIDGLDECIISMFGESDELENTELQIHDDYTNIPEGRADSNSNANGSDTTINRNTVDKVSLGNVFERGRKR